MWSASNHSLKPSVKALSITVLFTGLFGGCSTNMQMKVPADISRATDVISATDRSAWSGALADESFTLGPYKIIDVDRDWNRTKSSTLTISKLDLSSGNSKGAYAYKVKTPNGQLQGECVVRSSEDSLGKKGGLQLSSKTAKLNCTCTDGKTEIANVDISAENMDNFLGKLNVGGKSYNISSLKETESTFSIGVSGYRIDSDKPIAAVEVLKPGRIWLGKGLAETERSALSCNLVGLMLYMPLK